MDRVFFILMQSVANLLNNFINSHKNVNFIWQLSGNLHCFMWIKNVHIFDAKLLCAIFCRFYLSHLYLRRFDLVRDKDSHEKGCIA